MSDKSMFVHFSSSSDDWGTPKDFFDKVNKEYGPFDLDDCASKENAKCSKYYTKEQNGLQQEWIGKCWMNPPYGKTISLWMKKAFDESKNGALVVCLVPSRTDTRWWHEFAIKGEITFIKGRLKFGNKNNPAPFPSALIVFKPQQNKNKDV